MLGRLMVGKAIASSRGSASVSIAHELCEAHRDLGARKRGTVDDYPRSKLVRGVEILGILSNAVHQGVAVIVATILGLGSSASIDNAPVNLVVAGAFLSSVQVASVAASL